MNFHEKYVNSEIKPPSERSTGYVFSAAALLFAFFLRDSFYLAGSALVISASLAITSLLVPAMLRPLNIAWFKLGLLLHKIVNPIVMFLIFLVAIIPAGLIMRLRSDPLILRRSKGIETYWIERESKDQQSSSMTNQF